jgi:hypothetical protein
MSAHGDEFRALAAESRSLGYPSVADHLEATAILLDLSDRAIAANRAERAAVVARLDQLEAKIRDVLGPVPLTAWELPEIEATS